MKHCKNCGDEFEDWVKECPDCHVELTYGPKPLVEKTETPVDNSPAASFRGDYDELVTLATYSQLEKAYIATTKLQSEGIPAYVADEYVASLNYIKPGQVRVVIRESDVERALQILGLSEEDRQTGTGETEKCPQCGSRDVELSGLWTPFSKLKWECNTCGYKWKYQK
jgi:RNA polymerase subunit RPABC4/transcription elongation factor Spt4